MIEIIAHNMAPIIFASLVLFLLYGYPVSFALAANGLIFFVIGVWLAPYSNGEITLDWPLLGTCRNDCGGSCRTRPCFAIPFFTFMGIILDGPAWRRSAGHDWPAFRADPAAALPLPSSLSARFWQPPWRRCSVSHRHGSDLAADHAALRL